MNAKDSENLMPEVMRLERRARKGAELSSADIMDILRDRGAKLAGKKSTLLEVHWDDNVDRPNKLA